MKSPTVRLVAGLVFTLLVIGSYAAYTLQSVHRMREMQSGIIDRNLMASLQLIRIQNELHSLGLAMRDMLEGADDGYPLAAWRAPLERMRQNLDDAMSREALLAEGRRTVQQTVFLKSSFTEFWNSNEKVLALAKSGRETEARRLIRHTLRPRQEALTALTARLLVTNNDQETEAAARVQEIYSQLERNAYWFSGLSMGLVVLTGLSLIRSNRRFVSQLSALADQRRELAQRLIATQEDTFQTISRDLHDEFGQILTALGAMLRRAKTHAPTNEFSREVQEVSEVVQKTLEKIRSLSQSLHPVILAEQGLVAALEWHLSVFERHTGLQVHYRPPAVPVQIATAEAIHVFRVLQEALNNVARHAGVEEVFVSVETDGTQLQLTVEDNGKGMGENPSTGVGLTAMHERAELIGGELRVNRGASGGTAVQLRVALDRHQEVAVV